MSETLTCPLSGSIRIRATLSRTNQLFSRLRTEGVVAEARFSCCTTCATHELATVYPDREFVYYHEQNYEHVRRGGTLLLGFGAATSESTVFLGQRIHAAAEAVGLNVEWDGTARTKIAVCVLV